MGPVVVRGNYTVVDNKHFGITGGWKVEIVWAFQTPIPEWTLALPNSTRSVMDPFVPNIRAVKGLHKLDMGTMSQYAGWYTERAEVDEVSAMLNHVVSNKPVPPAVAGV